jgi:hypothetical protein
MPLHLLAGQQFVDAFDQRLATGQIRVAEIRRHRAQIQPARNERALQDGAQG